MGKKRLEILLLPGTDDLNEMIIDPLVRHVNRKMGREVLKIKPSIEMDKTIATGCNDHLNSRRA